MGRVSSTNGILKVVVPRRMPVPKPTAPVDAMAARATLPSKPRPATASKGSPPPPRASTQELKSPPRPRAAKWPTSGFSRWARHNTIDRDLLRTDEPVLHEVTHSYTNV